MAENTSVFPLVWGPPPNTPDNALDWVGNSLDPEAALTLVPVAQDEPWQSVGMLAQKYGARYVLGVFPPLLQLQQRLWHTLRSAGLPMMGVPPQQSKAIAALSAYVDLGGVVVPAAEYAPLREVLRGKDERLYWQVLWHAGEKPRFAPERHVYHEVHLAAGLMGLWQCPELAGSGKPLFHASDAFVWEGEGDTLYVSDRKVRFVRAKLPHKFSYNPSLCPCGAGATITYI